MGARPRGTVAFGALVALAAGCSSYSPPAMKVHVFPKSEAFFDEPSRPHETLGLVRTKVEYNSLHPEYDETQLCRNHFNQAVADLVSRARDAGGDAVKGVRSVTMLISGEMEAYPSAECADDGQTGQVLAQGIAIRWKDPEKKHRKPPMKLKEPPPLEPAPVEEGESRGSSAERRKKVRRPGDPLVVPE